MKVTVKWKSTNRDSLATYIAKRYGVVVINILNGSAELVGKYGDIFNYLKYQFIYTDEKIIEVMKHEKH